MYASMRDCVRDLEAHGHLKVVREEVDPNLVMAAVHRRVYAAGGPALYFERVLGSEFPAVSNLFGTLERGRFIFRDTMRRTADAIGLKANPEAALKKPWQYLWAPMVGWRALPKRVGRGPVLHGQTTLSALPQVKSWPDDGGPFITLPQVYSEHPDHPGPMKSNMGMYRVQLAGNDYTPDAEVGIHYQIHRGIGVHHAAALAKYLFIAAHEDDPALRLGDEGAFFEHVLRRLDLTRDLHFQTKTTIDTLDYSGTGFNSGSKVVLAAAGEPLRTLDSSLPADFVLPEGFGPAKVVRPGVLAVEGPAFAQMPGAAEALARDWAARGQLANAETGFPLVVLVDDADFVARSFDNFLWVTFTRSNPSHDLTGVGAFTEHKHWGSRGSLIIDARLKPHHAPPLIEDPAVERQVDALAAPGASLHGVF